MAETNLQEVQTVERCIYDLSTTCGDDDDNNANPNTIGVIAFAMFCARHPLIAPIECIVC